MMHGQKNIGAFFVMYKLKYIVLFTWNIVFCAVPVGNVSWMLFQ